MQEISWQAKELLASQEKALLREDILFTAYTTNAMKHSELLYSCMCRI
jgi:hypothetical protein